MSEMTGKVKEIFCGEVASGRNAGDPFWSITLDNDTKITCFKQEQEKGWIEGLKEDTAYTFTVKASGDYINVAGKTVPCIDQGEEEEGESKGEPVKVAKKAKPPIVKSNVGGERVFKNRISALASAVDFTIGVSATSTEAEVLTTAKKFLEFIEGK